MLGDALTSLFRVWRNRFCIVTVQLSASLLLVGLVASHTTSATAEEPDTGITLQFVARPVQPPTLDQAKSVGHAYLIIGRKTNFGIKEDVFGFYPASGGKGVIKGPGMLKAEYRCGPNDDCSSRGLRTTLSASTSVSVSVTAEQLRTVYQEMHKWNGKSLDPGSSALPSNRDYRLFDQNCIDFVSSVAVAVGYPTPPRTETQTPHEFIKALKIKVEQEVELRKAEARARAAEDKATAAEGRARAAEEAARTAEARAAEAARAAEEARAAAARAAEANRIPPGWVQCTCPERHGSHGRIISGVRYHPYGISCS